MNYFYDLFLNFNEENIYFYEWDEFDNIEHFKRIPVFQVNNKTLNDTTLNIEECLDEKGMISFDATNFDENVYSVYLGYEDTNDNYLAQVLFMFDNR